MNLSFLTNLVQQPQPPQQRQLRRQQQQPERRQQPHQQRQQHSTFIVHILGKDRKLFGHNHNNKLITFIAIKSA